MPCECLNDAEANVLNTIPYTIDKTVNSFIDNNTPFLLFDKTCALNCSLNKEIDKSETLCNHCNNCNNLNNDCTSSPNVSNILNFKCTETVDRNFNLFGSKKGLHIGCLNIQHILPKLDELKFLFAHASPSPDIFGFCETFLSDKVSDSELNISNFYLERKDR